MMPGSFVHPVERAILQSRLLPRDGCVVVAVSGGADSMALVEALRYVAGREVPRIIVAHFDHRLREDSARDAEHVQRYAAEHGLEFVLGVWGRRAKSASLEEVARAARYNFLSGLATSYGACVLTGHTRSDQAETILMRILRGTGRAGLAGIPERRGPFLRPLLGVDRADTRAYCEARGIGFVDDPSNEDVRHFRNRIRHQILPELRGAYPRIDDVLLGLAERAGREHAAFRAQLDLTKLVYEEEPGTWVLGLEAFAAFDDDDATSLLREALVRAELAHDVDAAHYARLLALVRSDRAGRSADLPGFRARREHDALVFVRRGSRDERTAGASAPIAIPGRTCVDGWTIDADFAPCDGAHSAREKDTAYFDADIVAAPLRARAPRPGDRMRPFGLAGRKKLSDLFVDRKVPRRYRERAIVVEGESILWVPGVAASDVGRIGPRTTRVLRLKATRA